MHNHIDQILAWTRDAKLFLESYSEPILSDADTCSYYRQKSKKNVPVKKIEAPVIPKKAIPPPPIPTPVAITAPVVATPLPLPLPKIELPPEPAPKRTEKSAAPLAKMFAKIAPELAVFGEIPSDAIAKKIRDRWKTKNQSTPITVIYFQENPEQKQLLEQIARALDVYFGPAKLLFVETIEREKEWKAFLSVDDLKLVIACDYTLWQLPNLMQFYKETPAQKTRQLGEKQLFMLPDLSLYLKDPLLKRSLWKALCQTLSSLPSPSTKN